MFLREKKLAVLFCQLLQRQETRGSGVCKSRKTQRETRLYLSVFLVKYHRNHIMITLRQCLGEHWDCNSQQKQKCYI